MSDAFEKLTSFLGRLERANRRYQLEGRPTTRTVRVLTWVANERWEVDFHSSGDVEIEVFQNPTFSRTRDEKKLESLFGRMRSVWRQAASDLGIRFESPFRLRTHLGEEVECAGWLPDFAGPKGMLIISMEDPDEVRDLAEEQGYYTSGLNPRYYELYDRDRFIGMLSELGYAGPPDRAPAWLKRGPT
jgi:hypothetical protein